MGVNNLKYMSRLEKSCIHKRVVFDFLFDGIAFLVFVVVPVIMYCVFFEENACL